MCNNHNLQSLFPTTAIGSLLIVAFVEGAFNAHHGMLLVKFLGIHRITVGVDC
jgi:hypothetical protein